MQDKIKLNELVNGALEEKFQQAFERIVKNLQDVNTSYKDKRGITLSLTFSQNELRDDVQVEISIKEKLAPQAKMKTAFAIGKNLKTGEVYANEYGKEIKGQMSIDDYVVHKEEPVNVDKDTGEILDFRKAAQ